MNYLIQQSNKERTKHDVVLPTSDSTRLDGAKLAGHALQFEGTNYFLLKLWERPRDTYYISKNRDDESGYTVFAKRVDELPDAPARFQNPVGFARIRNDMKSHLEVNLTLSRVRVFLSLFPST